MSSTETGAKSKSPPVILQSLSIKFSNVTTLIVRQSRIDRFLVVSVNPPKNRYSVLLPESDTEDIDISAP